MMNCKKLFKKTIYIINQKAKRIRILVNIHDLLFLRDVHEGHLSVEKADNKQSKNFGKGMKTLEKCLF